MDKLFIFHSLAIDFGKTTHDYGKHRVGFPPAFFERLTGFGIGLPGQRILDLGVGTGAVARGLAPLLAERFPANPLTVPHRVFAVICQTPSRD